SDRNHSQHEASHTRNHAAFFVAGKRNERGRATGRTRFRQVVCGGCLRRLESEHLPSHNAVASSADECLWTLRGEGFMHRLMAGVTILEHELSELRLLVERQTGILLDCPNSALAARVADYLETRQLESANVLLDGLRSPDRDPATLPQFLDGLLNTNTSFFRHHTAMNALTR